MEVKTITAFHRNDFRKWLEKYHKKEKKVAVIIHKKHTGKDSPSHRELMEEAICFGWIDTTIKRIDEDNSRKYCLEHTQEQASKNTI